MRTVGKIFPKPIPKVVSEPAPPKPEKEKPVKAPAEKKD